MTDWVLGIGLKSCVVYRTHGAPICISEVRDIQYCKPGGQGLKKLRCSFGDYIYIQNEVGRKRDVGSGTRPVQTQLFKKKKKNFELLFVKTFLKCPKRSLLISNSTHYIEKSFSQSCLSPVKNIANLFFI